MAPLITSVVTSYDPKNKLFNDKKSNDYFNVSIIVVRIFGVSETFVSKNNGLPEVVFSPGGFKEVNEAKRKS